MAFYRLPENYTDASRRSFKHHEQVLPRIIGSSGARNAASTYIYRAPFKEKIALTKMLNEWNSAAPHLDATKETNEVIRPKAATVIKEWLNNAQDNDASVAQKFLTYLNKESNGRSTTTSIQRSSFRQPSENEDSRPPWRPHTAKNITYGSFYPENGGIGNNTGVFNIVGNGADQLPVRNIRSANAIRREPNFNHMEPKPHPKVRFTTSPKIIRKKMSQPELQPKPPSQPPPPKTKIGKKPRARTATVRPTTENIPKEFLHNSVQESDHSIKKSQCQNTCQSPAKGKFTFSANFQYIADLKRRKKLKKKRLYHSQENLCHGGGGCCLPCPSPLPPTSYAYFYAAYPYEADRHGSRIGRPLEPCCSPGRYEVTET